MKSICICASQRFKEEVEKFAARLRELGVPLVFEPDFKYHRQDKITQEERERLRSKSYRDRIPGLVRGHFDKLRKSDICFVYNKGGYIGVNTTLEIGFAHGLDMVIYALEPEADVEYGGEVCRDILYTDVVPTPEELFKKIQ